jgi:hypothetical protein
MSDDRLVDYYLDYGPSRFGPVKRRSLQAKAKEFRLPIIRTGRSSLINPAKGDAQLQQFELHRQPTESRRGRPRAGG